MAAFAAAAIALYGDEPSTRLTAAGVNPDFNYQSPSSVKGSFTAAVVAGDPDFCMTLTVISQQASQSSMKPPITATGLTCVVSATDLMAMEGFKLNMSQQAVEI
jgi:hypothetical protein